MMLKRATSLLLFVGVLILSLGCVSETQPTVFPDPLPTLDNFATPTPALTSMTPASLTPTIALPTNTSVPTLSPEDAFAHMRSFLNNGPNCSMPCWWGIRPGISTISDVQTLVSTFSSIAKNKSSSGTGHPWATFEIYFHDTDRLIEISSAYLLSSEDTVELIAVTTQTLPENLIGRIYGDEKYNDLLSSYTLPKMLSTYGVPTQIFVTGQIFHNFEQSAPDFFDIRLLYPDKGIFVRYTAPAEINGENYITCPSESLIDLWFMPPDPGSSYQETLSTHTGEWYQFFSPSEYNKTTQEAFGITPEELLTIFGSDPSHCLMSPLSIWPLGR